MVQQKRRTLKKRVPEMLPVKEWISLEEALAYTDLSINIFLGVAAQKRLTVSCPTGKKKFYRVSEIKAMFEDSIIIRQ